MHRKSVGKTVLITGASTGIGAELAKRFAEGGFDLILVARNRDKLEQLAEEAGRRFGVSVRVVVKDLSEPAACGELIRELEEAGIEVHVLVNNAGIGVYGPFAETDWEREREMIRLNIEALTRLTKAFLPGMLRRGGGENSQCGLHRRVSAGPSDVGLLCFQGLCPFLYRSDCGGGPGDGGDGDGPLPRPHPDGIRFPGGVWNVQTVPARRNGCGDRRPGGFPGAHVRPAGGDPRAVQSLAGRFGPVFAPRADHEDHEKDPENTGGPGRNVNLPRRGTGRSAGRDWRIVWLHPVSSIPLYEY